MAWRPVLAVSAATTALLVAVSPRYGWHRDELYFLEAGRHLAWGYVDQPPFVPLVARIADELAPDNLVLLRLLPALATAATVVLGALLVRELGGSRRSQALGAAVVATSGFILGVGHLLSTAVFDLTAWMALLLVGAHLLRTGDPRWWLAFGGLAGVGLLNKNLLVLLVVALGTGMLLERRWDLLVSPWAVGGAGLAVAIAAPHLWWQADHGWPQFDMAKALAERLAGENRSTLLPLQLLFIGPLLIPTLVRGATWLGRDAGARTLRALLWAWPAGLIAAFVTAGRPYYVLPLTMTVALAGIVASEGRPPSRRLPWLVAGNAVIAVPLALPLLPLEAVEVAAQVNEAAAETVGWPELVTQVAAVVDDLPEGEQESVVLLTASYGEAGALDRFGSGHGLPPAFSPHNAYADFRQPDDESATVVAVRFSRDRLEPHFEECEQVATVDNGHDVETEVQGTPILVCRGLRDTWPATWERMRFLS